MDQGLEDTIIVGDINYDMLDKNNNKLQTFIDTHGFSNTISKGTRLNPTTHRFSLLDVILCYLLTSLTSSTVINCSFSDHSLIISAFNFSKKYNIPEKRLIRCLNNDKIVKIKSSLLNIFSNFTFVSKDVNTQWSLIKNVITSCIDATARLK